MNWLLNIWTQLSWIGIGEKIIAAIFVLAIIKIYHYFEK